VHITVRLFAGAREAAGTGTTRLDLPPGATAGDALAALVRQHPNLARIAAISRLAVDGEYVSPDAPLAEGAELAVLPPVSGGEE
jgi:molybdopterin converting factor subunit 1